MNKFAILAILVILALASQPAADAEKKTNKKTTFLVKVVYGVKADKEEVPSSLKPFEDALKDAGESGSIKKFSELASHELSVEISKSIEKDLGVNNYKLDINPTEYKNDTLKATICIIKFKGKKTTNLLRSKLSFKKNGVLVIELGKYKDGVLYLPLQLTKVE